MPGHMLLALLEHSKEATLCVAICVFAHVHDLLALNGLWHSRINKLLNGAKACDLDHLSHILL